MAALDPNQPSMRAMSMVKIRNNITDKELRKTLDQFEVEKSAAILMIDHDRLDMRDFLRSIKHCGSDSLPEARHWLRDGIHFPIKKKKKTRVIQTAPDQDQEQQKGGNPNDMDPWSDEWQNMDPFAKVRFAQRNAMRRNSAMIHMDIYSRRNMLSSIEREVKRPPPPGPIESGTGIRMRPQTHASAFEHPPSALSPVDEKLENDGDSLENKNVKFQEERDNQDCKSETNKTDVAEKIKDIKDMERMVENLRSPLPTPIPGSRGRIKTPTKRGKLPPATAPAPKGEQGEEGEDKFLRGKADILVIERDGSKTPRAREISRAPEKEKERPKTQGAEGSLGFLGKLADGFHHKTPKTAGDTRDTDLMKELLVKNARKRYKKSKKKDPIEDRLKAFYNKIDDVKKKEEAAAAAPMSKEVKRKWTLLTKGIDAALAESSDEEDDRKDTA